MCGRFTLFTDATALAEYFGLIEIPFALQPRYNIAPSQPVVAIRHNQQQEREAVMLRWGLIPSWMKPENISSKMINARAETIHEKPSYRNALKRRRCLIAASSFYEWQSTKDSNGKQPFNIQRTDEKPLAFAGIWEHWEHAEQGELESCSIITTTANKTISKIHQRMPVILEPEQFDTWLQVQVYDLAKLQALMQPCSNKFLNAFPVSKTVNNPRQDNPDCIAPLTE